MDHRLSSLDPVFRPLANALIAGCIEAGVMVIIGNTRRTAEEQAQAVATGHSKVAHSKHEDGLAIDLCLLAQYAAHGLNKLGWDAADPDWKIIGAIGESLGLRWGGRFTPLDKNGLGWDAGHFEYVAPAPTRTLTTQV